MNIKTSFLVADKYDVKISCSIFGLWKCFVNNKKVLSLRNNATRGSIIFNVGEEDYKHEVEVKFDLFPNIWIIQANWVAEAYVDGVLAVDDLTPNLRPKIRFLWRLPLVLWLISLIFSLNFG